MGALIAGVLFLIIGFVVRVYPGILAGFNNLSQIDKERTVKNGLPLFAALLFNLMGVFCIISYPVSIWLEMPNLTSIVQVLVTLLGVVILVVVGNLKASRR
ncbi:DUF3784 domain-containing protein [Algoriphagus marincola]|uniref:DUF3784 domain-containing protein n=1 Tax=Algoriphagus marincola TaxID=264027 RepID=UPI0004260E03|nr:DUF3784 domain-containing protein [Algoriphagus marincola]